MRVGKNSFKFEHTYLHSKAVVTGPLEQNGPIGNSFDDSCNDIKQKLLL